MKHMIKINCFKLLCLDISALEPQAEPQAPPNHQPFRQPAEIFDYSDASHLRDEGEV